MAIDALHHAQNRAKLQKELTGVSRRAEKRIYRCPECLGFHLTSHEAWHEVEVAA